MHKHRWLKLMLLASALLLVGGAGALEGASAASAKAICIKSCKSVRRECIGTAKSVKVAAMADCRAERLSSLSSCKVQELDALSTCETKTCRKEARTAFRLCKKEAKSVFKMCKKDATNVLTGSKETCIEELKACRVGCKGEAAPCQPNEAGGPNLLTMRIVDGSDLDAGWTGVGHNSGVVIGAAIYGCLQGCDTGTNPLCTGTGPTGPGSLNGKTLDPPLPLLAADVATCVVNEFTEDVTIRELNLQTGEVEMRVKLNSIVHLTGDKNNPCPTCSGETVGAVGKCRGLTPGLGNSCTTEGTTRRFGNTSSDCPPFVADNAGELEVELDPISSGTVTREADIPCSGGLCLCTGGGNPPSMNECDDPFSCSEQVCIDNGGSEDVRKGIQPGVDQQCCKKARETIPCFTSVISRTGEAVAGEPAWPDPTYPKTAEGGKVAGVFCIPPTNSSVINQPTGLGGPGAFVLSGSARVEYAE